MRTYRRKGKDYIGNTDPWWDLEVKWLKRWKANGKRGKVSKEKK